MFAHRNENKSRESGICYIELFAKSLLLQHVNAKYILLHLPFFSDLNHGRVVLK